MKYNKKQIIKWKNEFVVNVFPENKSWRLVIFFDHRKSQRVLESDISFVSEDEADKAVNVWESQSTKDIEQRVETILFQDKEARQKGQRKNTIATWSGIFLILEELEDEKEYFHKIEYFNGSSTRVNQKTTHIISRKEAKKAVQKWKAFKIIDIREKACALKFADQKARLE